MNWQEVLKEYSLEVNVDFKLVEENYLEGGFIEEEVVRGGFLVYIVDGDIQ